MSVPSRFLADFALLVSAENLMALDARVVVHPIEVKEERLPRPAIRPYPNDYVATWTMKDGTPATIRPIRPEDEPLMVEFHRRLSEHSVYMRYFHMVSLDQRVAHERLTRICFIDYDREMALVAERTDSVTGLRAIVAVGRLSKLTGTNDGEVAIVVIDEFQGRGLGSELLRRLLEVGRDERLERITADMLPENREMQHLCQKLGFRLRHDIYEQTTKAEIGLSAALLERSS